MIMEFCFNIVRFKEPMKIYQYFDFYVIVQSDVKPK
jgi:hypothetical protein